VECGEGTAGIRPKEECMQRVFPGLGEKFRSALPRRWVEADLAGEFGRILKSVEELLFQNLLPIGLSCEPLSPIVEVEALIGVRFESCGELGVVPLDGVPVLGASSAVGRAPA